jgi:hypothetical protein
MKRRKIEDSGGKTKIAKSPGGKLFAIFEKRRLPNRTAFISG